ncbi:hypothetical protein ACVBIO_01090 [Shewanella sp. 0m-8]
MRKDRVQAKQRFLGSTYVGFNSNTGNTAILESNLELIFWRRELFFNTHKIKMQPSPLKHYCNGRLVNYTPDAEYMKDGIHYVVEIKYLKDILKPDNQEKFKFIKAEYKLQGKEFITVSEEELYNGYESENIAMLLPSLRHPSPLLEVKALQTLLNETKYTYQELLYLADELGVKRVFVKRAIAHRLFYVDLSLHISNWLVSGNQ